MILCVSILSNKSLMEEATKCLFRTSLRSTHSTKMCFTVSGHWQVPHSGKSSPESRKECVKRVWPIRCLFSNTVLPKFHYTNFTETSPRQKSTTRLRLVSGKFRGNELTDLSWGSFVESKSNELDMLSSLACLGEVCDKSTTSLGGGDLCLTHLHSTPS